MFKEMNRDLDYIMEYNGLKNKEICWVTMK